MSEPSLLFPATPWVIKPLVLDLDGLLNCLGLGEETDPRV